MATSLKTSGDSEKTADSRLLRTENDAVFASPIFSLGLRLLGIRLGLMNAAGKPAVVFFSCPGTPMTETITIPAHIENGSLCLDAPLPMDLERVEVRGFRSPRPNASAIHDLATFLESLPPGTRSKEDIDREIEEGRGSWR